MKPGFGFTITVTTLEFSKVLLLRREITLLDTSICSLYLSKVLQRTEIVSQGHCVSICVCEMAHLCTDRIGPRFL